MNLPTEDSRARARRERGAALIEFAFILPVLILLVLGIIDFGRAYGAKQAMIHATREAVRVYAVTQSSVEAFEAFQDGATGLDVSRMTVTIPPDDSCQPGDPVTVSATYDFEFIALPDSAFPNVELESQAVMQCGG